MIAKNNQTLIKEYELEWGSLQPNFTPRKADTPLLVPKTSNELKVLNSNLMQTIEEKRAALELRKLDIEIEKLNSPNTSIDYFKQMLDLQQQHFNQLLTMQKEQSNLMLEIEKLKMGGEGDDMSLTLLDMVKPLLPQILEGKMKEKGGEKMNQEQYLKKIKSGEISCEEAWEDFKLELPKMAEKMTYEEFKPKFEAIKNQKE